MKLKKSPAVDNCACSDKAEVDCKYTSTGHCDDCSLPENEICPYEYYAGGNKCI